MKRIKIHDIMSKSSADDWELNVDTGHLTHKSIKTLVISRVIHLPDSDKSNFWERHFNLEKSRKVEFLIQYVESYLARYSFIEIGLESVILPIPRMGTDEITDEQFNLAIIINSNHDVSSYIKQASLKIIPTLYL